jgi:hypothetical protein
MGTVVSADDVLPPRSAPDMELRHGYTLNQVRGLSIWTVLHNRYQAFADFDERLEVAWHAIIEHLYTSGQPPARPELIRVAWQAISHHVSKDEHFRRGTSQDNRDRDAPFTTGFMKYWHDTGRDGPEVRATEYLALAQIWARLRPKDRELLAAMAEHEDYGKAAAALGKSRHAYATEIGRARKAFRELWHEGETPSRPWGADRRAYKPDSPKMRVTYRLTVRRRAAQARASARQAGKQQRGTEPATEHHKRQ